MLQSVPLSSLFAVLVLGLLSGCGADEGAAKPASQVAVKVNKDEISVHQLNTLLMRSDPVPPEMLKQAGTAALERLIDQQLLVQQAKERKLERDPKVMQAIEVARREILARSYVEQVVGIDQRPTEAQISTYYADNPGLFSRRRVYNLQELNIQVDAARYDEIRKQADASANLEEMATWLKTRGIPFAANAGFKPAEQLPPEIVTGLLPLQAGEMAVSRTPAGMLLLYIADVKEEPIDQANARPYVEQILVRQARTERAEAEIKRLREIATIEYVGDFTPGGPTQAPVAPATMPDDRAAFEKGAAGLK